jgi:GDSL-like Lipase/Acylhydrolase family
MRNVMSRQLIVTLAILACGLVPDRLWRDGPTHLRGSLKSNLLNRVDLDQIERGYYEQLIVPSRRLDDLADVPGLRLRGSRSGTWSVPLDDTPLVMRVQDLREVVLKPDDDTFNKGVHWQTNSQGMRDRPYSVAKPARAFRIALVGDSIGAGWGVDVERRFESILERTWDARSQAASGLAVEIINCAVPGQSPGQRWCHFSQVGWPMNPDMVIYESTASDVGWDERRLRYLLARGIGWDSPVYRGALERAGVAQLGSPDDYKRALRPRHWDILAGVYQTMVAECRSMGVPIVWLLVPRVGRPNDQPDQRALVKAARAADVTRIVDVTDAYDGLEPAALAVAPDDFHPNAKAHERLAHRLDRAMSGLPELRPLWALRLGHVDRQDPAHSRAPTSTPRPRDDAANVAHKKNRAGEPQ